MNYKEEYKKISEKYDTGETLNSSGNETYEFEEQIIIRNPGIKTIIPKIHEVLDGPDY